MSARRARDLLHGHPAEVAPWLLGGVLTSQAGGNVVRLRITEVEAYGGVGEDPGSHAFRRMTERNATMFGPPGHAYVYFTYGMHWCVNVVVRETGSAGAILIRAGEVIEGQDAARARRPAAVRGCDLARGPARLTTALGIRGEQDGVDLLSRGSGLSLVLPTEPEPTYITGPRTGVAGPGAATPWRFALDHESVSPYRPARARAPR